MNSQAGSNVKWVRVSVDAQGQVSVLPTVAVVDTPDTLLGFSLATDGWVFPETGAIVVNGPTTAFPLPPWIAKPQLALLLDTGAVQGEFPYTVTVEHVESGRRARIDPTIKNEE